MRRLIDIVVAVTASVVLAPVLFMVAIGICCTDGSPVLFRQERWGRDREVFVIWKFRTMRAPVAPGEPDNVRLIPLGRFLRASSLDELPQLWNIIRGDMSLIGPRPWPVLPGDEDLYTPRQWGRLAVRPGLTGWAQVKGRNSRPGPERIEQDLWYIAHRSLLLDLRIIALTVRQLVRPSGLYGYGAENLGLAAEPQRSTGEQALPTSPTASPSPAHIRSHEDRHSRRSYGTRRTPTPDNRGARAPAKNAYGEASR
jgi:lipopolysaccharide/colanic/teichoic acid biosynthesis glycosyltransferase